MMDVDVLITRVPDVDLRDLEHWIAMAWVRPCSENGHRVFREIDIARVQLIQDLRIIMQIDDNALPVVLSLLDQLYDMRRRMHEVTEALALISSDGFHVALMEKLAFSE